LNHYNPDHAPNPAQWLTLDEQTRIDLAEEYHRAHRIKLPTVQAHAMFHVVVENQIAEELEYVVRAMARLAAEGLSRHDAIHAIGSVLAEHLHGLLNASTGEKHPMTDYAAAVERLTAKGWRDS
jgi:hypothetical protein